MLKAVTRCARRSWRPTPILTRNTIVLTAGLFRLTVGGVGEDFAELGDLEHRRRADHHRSLDGRTIIDAAGLDRVFDVLPGATLILENITITGGVAPTGEDGGGIRNAGALILRNQHLDWQHHAARWRCDRQPHRCKSRTRQRHAVGQSGGARRSHFHAGSLHDITSQTPPSCATAGPAQHDHCQQLATTTGGGIFNAAGATARARNTSSHQFRSRRPRSERRLCFGRQLT